jgi:hypothetical protein
MKAITCNWQPDDSAHTLELVYVEGTAGRPFLFGEDNHKRPIEVPGF